MAGNIFGSSFGQPNFFWPTATVQISALPINASNVQTIYRVNNSTGAYESWRPNRAINDFDQLEVHRIHIIIALENIDLSAQGNTQGQVTTTTGGNGIQVEDGTAEITGGGSIQPEDGTVENG